MQKWPVVKGKHVKIELRIYVLFAFELDDACKIIETKHQQLNKYLLGRQVSVNR